MKIIKYALSVSSIVFLLVSCDIFLPQALSPPEWIIGTWSDVSDVNTWTFTSDNAIFTLNTTGFGAPTSIDFKEMRKMSGVDISDESSTTTYRLKMEAGGVFGSYKFEKTSQNIFGNWYPFLNYTVTTAGISVGPLELYPE